MFFFTSTAVDPPATIYMGKDKYENEELIKTAHPTDLWFHVDDLSSAHVYFRVTDNDDSLELIKSMQGPNFKVSKDLPITPEEMPEALLKDLYQLVKHHSIEGSKRQTVSIVYTPTFNLKKTAGMDPGQVGFHQQSLVKKVTGIARDPPNLKRLLKTKKEEELQALITMNDERQRESRKRLKKLADERRNETNRAIKDKKERAELESYSSLFAEVPKVSNRNQPIDEDDFM